MSKSTAKKRLPPCSAPNEARAKEDPRHTKARVQQLAERISHMILEKPEAAKKAAAILSQWLKNS